MTSLLSSSSHFPHTFSPPKHPLLLPPPKSFSFETSPFTAPNSIVPRSQVIEHIALLKPRPDADLSLALTNLSSSLSLSPARHVAVLPIHRTKISPNPNPSFTHIIHTRHHSKRDLHAYYKSPNHALWLKQVRRACEAILTVDWVGVEFNGPTSIPPMSAVRVALLRPKGGEGNAWFLKTMREEKGDFGGPGMLTSGLNFSPEGAMGFTAGMVSRWAGKKRMENVAQNEFLGKAKEYFELLVVDYLIVRK